jgi:hypothetical protein
MDYLESEPIVDFLGEEVKAFEEDWKCVRCSHALTLHTRGMVVHDRCLLAGCDCNRAVLTESAARKMKHGIMP